MTTRTLLEQLADHKKLYAAWGRLNKSNQQSKGIDAQTIQQFGASLRSEVPAISKKLKASSYEFTALRGRPIEKGTGDSGKIKYRPLRIPTVRDRLVLKAIEQVIKTDIERAFHISKKPNSFAYMKQTKRRPKGVYPAAMAVQQYYLGGKRWVYKGDIEGFFDNVNREILLKDVLPVLRDDSINELITNALNLEIDNRAELAQLGYDVDDLYPDVGRGIPQGGILSPMFSNVVLAPLDDAFIKEGLNSVRYADDFIVMCQNQKEAEQAEVLAQEIVGKKLGLTLHPVGGAGKASIISDLEHIDFLGLDFHRSKITPGNKAFEKMIKTLKDLPPDRCTDLVSGLAYLRARTRSWGGTYWYTNPNPAYYAALNQQLLIATKGLLHDSGLSFNKSPTLNSINRLGMYSFNQEVDRAKSHKTGLV